MRFDLSYEDYKLFESFLKNPQDFEQKQDDATGYHKYFTFEFVDSNSIVEFHGPHVENPEGGP